MKMLWVSGRFVRGVVMLLLAVAGWFFIVPAILRWAAPSDLYMLRAIIVMGLGYGGAIILGFLGVITIVRALAD